MNFYTFLKNLWALKSIWITIIAFCVPLPLVILNIGGDPALWKESRCAYVICVMAIMWLTEAIPISATSLMPVVLVPMLKIATAKDMSSTYITDTSMLFLGGLIIAVAIETCGLHKRIALGTMRIVGAQPIMLMVGLMVPTWFLSMWISNTAATAMMVPIIWAVIKTLDSVQNKAQDFEGLDNVGYDMDDMEKKTETIASNASAISYQNVQKSSSIPNQPGDMSGKNEEQKRLAKGFALCVAYAANIGGIATLTGTPPNLVLKELADLNYRETSGLDNIESEINFAKWMGFAFPLSLLMLVLAWLWLQLIFIRCGCCRKMSPSVKKAVGRAVYDEYQTLGPFKWAEGVVLSVFLLLIALWLSRSPPNDAGGWGEGFEVKGKSMVSDSTPVILLCLVLFIMPASLPEVFCWAKNRSKPLYTPILSWRAVQEKVPWGVIILLGGGFALAKASLLSGLSKYLGEQLRSFADYDEWVMNLIICCIVAGATEVTSNTATSQLLLPIMFSLAISIGVHPLYLMMSTAVACSFAFMLPVATPPNAIVFATGYLSIPDMAVAGLPMNIIAIGCLTLAINTWGKAMFDLDTFPAVLVNGTT